MELHWWILYKITPWGIHVSSCPHSLIISLWGISTRHSLNRPKYPYDSTSLENCIFSICLIIYPYPRTSPPYKLDSHEHNYSRWSYPLYSLNIPITFNVPHIRSTSHGLPQKHLCGIHWQRIVLTFIFGCPTATVQTKTSCILLCNVTLVRRYPSSLASLEEHRDFFDQLRSLLDPTIRHIKFCSPSPLRFFFILAKPSRYPTG